MTDPGLLAAIHRHLAAPESGSQSAAIGAAIDFADQAAMVAWDEAEGRPPVERLLLALQAAAEELEGIGFELAAAEAAAAADPSREGLAHGRTRQRAESEDA